MAKKKTVKNNKPKKSLLERIIELEKLAKRTNSVLNKHINEPYVTILIKEKDGSWGDWTGVFGLDTEEKLNVELKKTEEHFNRYFKGQYPDREFKIVKNVNGKNVTHKILKGG